MEPNRKPRIVYEIIFFIEAWRIHTRERKVSVERIKKSLDFPYIKDKLGLLLYHTQELTQKSET